MIRNTLNRHFSSFRSGLEEREPQAVFLAILVVVLLLFAGTLSWLYLTNGPSELDVGSFGRNGNGGSQDPTGPQPAQEDETEPGPLIFSNFNAQAQRMTITTDEFETTTHLPFPKQSSIKNATLSIAPTTMQTGREYFDASYTFHGLGDLDRDGVGDRVSVVHSGGSGSYPELEIVGGKDHKAITIPLDPVISRLIGLDFTENIKLPSGHAVGFSSQLDHLQDEVKNITTHLHPLQFSPLITLLTDFSGDGYPDLIFILKDLYAIIYLENTGTEGFFGQAGSTAENATFELFRVFDIEAIFTYSLFENGDYLPDFTPRLKDIDNDQNPELFIWFSVTDSVYRFNTAIPRGYLISFDDRFFNGDPYQSASGNVVVSSGMVFFKGIAGRNQDPGSRGGAGEVLGFPVFFSNYELIDPQILFLPERTELEDSLGSELYEELLFRENRSSPLYTQEDIEEAERDLIEGNRGGDDQENSVKTGDLTRRLVLESFEENETFYLNFDVLLFYPNSITEFLDEEREYTPVTNTGFMLHYEYRKTDAGISYDNHLSLLNLNYDTKAMEPGEEHYYPSYYGRELPYSYLGFEWENGTSHLLVRKSIIKEKVALHDEGLRIPLEKTDVITIIHDDFGKGVLAYAHWDSVSTGDVNGDGVSDLVALRQLNKRNFVIYVFVYRPEREGNGRFVLGQKLYLDEQDMEEDLGANMNTYSSSAIIALADLTGSGTADLLYINGNNTFIFPSTKESASYLNQKRVPSPGKETLLPEERIQEYVYQYAVIHGSAYKGPFYLPDNTSSSFCLLGGYTYKSPGHFTSNKVILLTDIDHDGDIDLGGFATISESGTTYNQLYTFVNHGTGDLSENVAYQENRYLVANSFNEIVKRVSFDFNKDGIEELVVLHSRGIGDYYFDIFSRSSSSGVFLAARIDYFRASTIEDFFLWDFDNDGLTDVIFRDTTQYSFSFYRHQQWWTFTEVTTGIPLFNTITVETTITQPSTTERYIAFHDFNDDGKDELLLVQRDTSLHPYGFVVSLFHETTFGAVMKTGVRIDENFYNTLHVSFVDMDAEGFEEIVLGFKKRIVVCEIDPGNWSLTFNEAYHDMDLEELSLTDTLPFVDVELHSEPLFLDVNRDGFQDMLVLLEVDAGSSSGTYVHIILYAPPPVGPLPYPFLLDLGAGSISCLKIMDFDFDGEDELVLLTTDAFYFIIQNEEYEMNETLLSDLSENFRDYKNGTTDLDTFATFLTQLATASSSPLTILASNPHNLSLSTSTPSILAGFLNLSSETALALRQKMQALSPDPGEYYRENFLSFVDFMVLDRHYLWSLATQIHGYPQSLQVYLAEAGDAGITKPLYSIDGVFFQEHTIDISYELSSYLESAPALNGIVNIPLTFILGDRQAVYGSSRSIFDVAVKVEYELPELEVHGLKVKGKLVGGGNVEVTARIRNTGTIPAEYFSVTLFVDDENVARKNVDTLFPGQETKLDFEWEPSLFSDVGEHTISVAVDENGEIIESQRSNNMASTTVTVERNEVYHAGFYMLLALVVLGASFYLYRDSLEWRLKRSYERSGSKVKSSEEMLAFMKKENIPISALQGDYRNARTYLKDHRFAESSARAESVARMACQMMDSSMPDLFLNYPEVVFSSLKQWCSIPLHIVNSGETGAVQVRTRVLGNVKIMDNIMPFKLPKGEKKEIVFGVYPHRFGEFEFRVKLRFAKLHDEKKKTYVCQIRFRLRCEPERKDQHV